KLFLLTAFVVITTVAYSACQVSCQFRYLYRKYNQYQSSGTYSGDQIGTTTLFGGGGVSVYGNSNYENVWTNTYSGDVVFRSGYELNEALGREQFNNNSIVAQIKWSNGGYSIVVLLKWTTNMKYLTEQE